MTNSKLILKYPKIFVEYEGNPRMINYLDIPDQWIDIIDRLCGCIQDYIDNNEYSIPNPEYIEGSKWNKDDITTKPYIYQKHEQLMCFQVKEKFGGLRFYVSYHNDILDGMIKMAEYECWNTCIKCGSKEDLTTTSGWVSRVCKNCLTIK